MLKENKAVWAKIALLYGNMATWQHGNMATWQHGNMATWQHGNNFALAWRG